MKKILFGFILIVFSAVITAQTYYPFPTDTAQWSILYSMSYPSPGPSIINTIHQNLRGDTIINGNTYKKIYESYYEDYFTPYQHLKCFIREDTEKKVYLKYPFNSPDFPDTSEFVLYDFNLAIGDTFNTKMEATTSIIQQCKFRLDSIGSFSTNTDYRKKYNFTFFSFGTEPPMNCFGTPFSWVEGVGSMIGPFYNEMFMYCQVGGIAYSFDLICYQEQFNYIIGGNNCNIITEIGENKQVEYYINAYPNPAKDKITFTYQLPENINSASIKLYNTLGIPVIEIPLTNKQNSKSISVSDLSGGVYFYRLSDEMHSCQGKSIVIVK